MLAALNSIPLDGPNWCRGSHHFRQQSAIYGTMHRHQPLVATGSRRSDRSYYRHGSQPQPGHGVPDANTPEGDAAYPRQADDRLGDGYVLPDRYSPVYRRGWGTRRQRRRVAQHEVAPGRTASLRAARAPAGHGLDAVRHTLLD